MTDLEITKACADAMGIKVTVENIMINPPKPLGYWIMDNGRPLKPYDPLHDDAQMAALQKKFRLHTYHFHTWHAGAAININRKPTAREAVVTDEDLNRAVCQCVANMFETVGIDASISRRELAAEQMDREAVIVEPEG